MDAHDVLLHLLYCCRYVWSSPRGRGPLVPDSRWWASSLHSHRSRRSVSGACGGGGGAGGQVVNFFAFFLSQAGHP
jgi:hypothetical protein